MSIDLTPFRTATKLEWQQWTVFAPGRADDGTLVADGVHRLPLDTWTKDSLVGLRAKWPPISQNVGIAVVDNPVTLEDVHAVIRDWCLEQLGRSDVEFPA